MRTIIKEFSMTINGNPVATKDKLPVINPANEKIIAQVPIASKVDLDHAVEAAKKAFQKWTVLSVDDREAKLIAFADAIYQHREELAELFTLEMGRPIKLALVEIEGAVETCKALSKKDCHAKSLNKKKITILKDIILHLVLQV